MIRVTANDDGGDVGRTWNTELLLQQQQCVQVKPF